MSEPVSALAGAVHSGDVTISDTGLRGMITLRGDLSDEKIQTACTKLTGVAFPKVGECHAKGDAALAWMSPDELLIMTDYAAVAKNMETLQKSLGKTHVLSVNVSDARAVLRVQGQGARDVMAKLAPIDLDPSVFGVGTFRRTRIAQIAAAFWMTDAQTFEVICFRSVADYAFGLLSKATDGGPVGLFND
jgi:sarcosine oxidase subunit gamma